MHALCLPVHAPSCPELPLFPVLYFVFPEGCPFKVNEFKKEIPNFPIGFHWASECRPEELEQPKSRLALLELRQSLRFEQPTGVVTRGFAKVRPSKALMPRNYKHAWTPRRAQKG